jgi:hypothetical protein
MRILLTPCSRPDREMISKVDLLPLVLAERLGELEPVGVLARIIRKDRM